jgi:hypothetical protein
MLRALWNNTALRNAVIFVCLFPLLYSRFYRLGGLFIYVIIIANIVMKLGGLGLIVYT